MHSIAMSSFPAFLTEQDQTKTVTDPVKPLQITCLEPRGLGSVYVTYSAAYSLTTAVF